MHVKAMGTLDKDGNITDSIDDISLGTVTDANEAIDVIKDAIDYVSRERANLGAYQNRLEHTESNINVTKENIQSAESIIRDTDMSDEIVAYTKNNILIQSAQAMMAQANSLPQMILQLMQ